MEDDEQAVTATFYCEERNGRGEEIKGNRQVLRR